MDLVMIQYIEISLIGVVMLLTMLFYIVGIRRDYTGEDQKLFVKLLICNIVILSADICIYLIRGRYSPTLVIINHFMCMSYFIMHSYFGYLWLRYTIKKLYPEYEVDKKMKALLIVPSLISWAFIITSPWTKWVYYLTDENRYMRGEYMVAITAIAYLYWIFSAALTIIEKIQQKRIREQNLYFALLTFPIPTVIGNVLQLKFYGLTIVWVCSALSLLILFINLQNYQLSRDMLTGLFNRRQTNSQIMWEINHLNNADYLLFVIMVDVDHFKQINDRFGHVVGDEALIGVSYILKKSCREKDFVARLGGDEFIIVGHVKGNEEIDLLISNIKRRVAIYNSDESLVYEISLSTGYGIYSKADNPSIDSIISFADKEMYKNKMLNSTP